MIAAVRHDDFQGKRVHCYPVRVQLNDSRSCSTVATFWHSVISCSAADAADSVRRAYLTRAETEITVFGPKGGTAATRYIGWHTAIGAQLFTGRPSHVQHGLPFGESDPYLDARRAANLQQLSA